ncbi:hypothetical protein T484DRAFT_1746066 [Baffinella frigidus]|nr:hypothetical protein T484DRAFT_1746066 [Cryptophyta sp. CCMP2293]
METADIPSLFTAPRGLAIGEVDDSFVCGICDGLLREPRHSISCEHLFCRRCYEAALEKEACCPACKEPVDASEKLHVFGPFAAMVDNIDVRCSNGTARTGGQGTNISQEPAPSTTCSPGSVQAAGVKKKVDGGEEEEEEAEDNALPRAGGVGQSESSTSPFDGIHVGAPCNILPRPP